MSTFWTPLGGNPFALAAASTSTSAPTLPSAVLSFQPWSTMFNTADNYTAASPLGAGAAVYASNLNSLTWTSNTGAVRVPAGVHVVEVAGNAYGVNPMKVDFALFGNGMELPGTTLSNNVQDYYSTQYSNMRWVVKVTGATDLQIRVKAGMQYGEIYFPAYWSLQVRTVAAT